MGLEDFEKELAASKEQRHSDEHRSSKDRRDKNRDRDRDRDRRRKHDDDQQSDRHQSKRRHHHHHHHHSRSSNHDRDRSTERHPRHHRSDRHRDKRRRSNSSEESEARDKVPASPTEEVLDARLNELENTGSGRDAWMQAPSALDLDYVQNPRTEKPERSQFVAANANDFGETHKSHLQEPARDLQADEDEADLMDATPAQHHVSYTFGDSGSQWRMMKLRTVYRQAEESGRSVDDVAYEKYGGFRDFDDAREEERELDRRQRYGKDYVGLEKPSGELFQERKRAVGHTRTERSNTAEEGAPNDETSSRAESGPALDATALNKLKAQVMKAKLRKAPDAADLEARYQAALATPSAGSGVAYGSDVTVLEHMDRSLLTDRAGQVTAITNKRGRERGLVEENEDMTIQDMVRHEKATRGGSGREFADRIAKDARFKEDLDYMDDNATRLAKVAPKSDINMRNITANEYNKIKRQLDSCPLCSHEDRDQPPAAPVLSLGTRTFLTLPTLPELTPPEVKVVKGTPPKLHGAIIAPIKHRNNLLECDDDEWEEIRNFMKSLTRMYHDLDKGVVFYEDAARKRHAALVAVPLEHHLVETAPAFFKEAILAQAEEWTQHRKIIDTSAMSKQAGYGRMTVRKALHRDMPYFHVWFTIDGGLGHIIEDVDAWPRGELFARDVLGGMLDMTREDIKKQGRWVRDDTRMSENVREFRRVWDRPAYNWTQALIDANPP